MPTIPGTKSNASLTPQQALEKVTGLITELGEDQPETPEVAAPEAPASASAPPEPADQPPAPEPETADVDTTEEEVVVDGEPIKVSRAELKRNYSQHAHNTQRAQELSEREKKLEPEIRARVEQELQADRLRYLQGLQELDQALGRLEGEPDWVKRRTELSDADFLKEKADWEASKAQREQLRRHAAEEAQKAQAAQAQQHLQFLRAEEQKLVAAVPEWADTAKGKAEIGKLAEFVRVKYQVPEAQVAQAFQTAAVILLVRDAYRYAELHREPNAAQRKPPAIKTARPGTPERPRPDAERQKILDSTRSGRSRDAAKAIEQLLLPD
jgi:hypothetical protein